MNRPWWRLPVCWLGYCGHKAACDDSGCWAECVTCGSKGAFVPRDVLRTAADREYAQWLREQAEEASQTSAATATAYGAEPSQAQRSAPHPETTTTSHDHTKGGA